jgi:subtilisin family serine protease
MDSSHPAGSRRRAAKLGLTAMAAGPLVVSSLYGAATAAADPAAPGGAASQVTVVAQFSPAVIHAGSVAAAAVGHPARAEPAGRYVAVVPAAQAAAVVARLRAQEGVLYAEVARPVHAMDSSVSPDDQCYMVGCPAGGGSSAVVNQAYLQTIGAPQAWAVSKGDGVKVAVLDTGADSKHADLQGKIVRQTDVCGADPQCGDTSVDDDNGHGTHVTGILAADTNNQIGVASLGWNVLVDEYKVLDQDGNGFTSDVDTAIYDAVAAGDRVINLSLANYSCQQSPSDCGPDPDEQAAVEYAIAHNVVVVAAAGNGINGLPGDNGATFPASYPGVLGVAATDNSGAVQSFSQWGPAANIAAPGVNIISTWNDGSYRVDTGTSMSAPQVAAAAALLISHDPSLSSQQVTELLESSARPTRGGNPIYGGLLDAPAALSASARTPTSFLGYDLAGADGSVYSFGSVGAFGSLAGHRLAQPVVGEAVLPDGLGYWLVASDGGVFSFGKAAFHGSTGGVRLNKPVVGMAATPDGKGYWLVASDGGIFAFGDARFFGSTGGVRLNKPVVGMASTPDGKGYWLVASDGGIFAFGDARFFGSTGDVRLNKPVVGIARTTDARGYWMVASDGGIFAFGDAHFRGSAGGVTLARPVVGMAATPSSNGYWLVASDGGVFNYGDARFYGSTGGGPIPAPVVGVAS